MASPYEFTHVYKIQFVAGDYLIDGAATPGPFTVVDSADVGDTLEPGELVSVNAKFYIYEGWTAQGDILLSQASFATTEYFLLSKNASLINGSEIQVTASVWCFLAGTEIVTKRGLVKVEELTAGDSILCSGESYAVVRWVGVQTLSPMFSGRNSYPVKISQNALGDNTPNSDLYVSQDHAIFLDGVLVAAGALVNGSSISIETNCPEVIKYYGIDLGPATIHLVHNLLVGSLGGVPREQFDNYQEWLDSGHDLIDEPLMFPRVTSSIQLPWQIKKDISA
jgi:hypothetical protein